MAAHRTLPFDTWVRVVNLDNEKSVEVRIIDRGPFVDGRIIDLSHAAARAIDLIGPGTAPVRVEVIRAPGGPRGGAVRGPGGRLSRPRQCRARAGAMASGTARRGWCCARATRTCGACWWGRRPTQDGAARLAERIRRESGERKCVRGATRFPA